MISSCQRPISQPRTMAPVVPTPPPTPAGYVEWRYKTDLCNCKLDAYGLEFSYKTKLDSQDRIFHSMDLKFYIIKSINATDINYQEKGITAETNGNLLDMVYFK